MSLDFNITILAKKTLEFKDLKKKLEYLFGSKIKMVEILKSKHSKERTIRILIISPDIKNIESFIEASKKFLDDELLIIFLLNPKKPEQYSHMKNIKVVNYPLVMNEFFLSILRLLQTHLNSLSFSNARFMYWSDKSIILNKKKKTKIKLTELENKFFSFMLSVKKPVTKSEILAKVWHHQKELDTHTLQSLIYRLRNKIESNPKNPKFLVTVGEKYFLDYSAMFQ